MKRVAVLLSPLLLVAAASAQEGDPLLEELGREAPPSELDALSAGENPDFPNIETVERRAPVSVTIRALNKTTAKFVDIVIGMGKTARFGALEITPRFCDKRPPEEFPETTAFLEIADMSAKKKSDLKVVQPEKDGAKKKAVGPEAAAAPASAPAAAGVSHAERSAAAEAASAPALPENMIFSGWMFASSPALNGLEHPVYDVWVIDCKTSKVEG